MESADCFRGSPPSSWGIYTFYVLFREFFDFRPSSCIIWPFMSCIC